MTGAASQSLTLPIRGWQYHLRCWGEPRPAEPPLLLLHGWMDHSASYQFIVEALSRQRYVLAPDWRGFGRTRGPATDAYWFADYLADLDALIDALSPDQPVDLVGHSMGANAAMLYAGVRPHRVRGLVNLEGFGLPHHTPDMAPARYAQWLDELKTPQRLRSAPSLEAVAQRLMAINPRLRADRAAWLAPHWAELREDGAYHPRSDAAHKRIHPILYRAEEVLACWRAIAAPVLWVEGRHTRLLQGWGQRYTRAEIEARAAVIPRLERAWIDDAGHMLHHEQPEVAAALIDGFFERFFSQPCPPQDET